METRTDLLSLLRFIKDTPLPLHLNIRTSITAPRDFHMIVRVVPVQLTIPLRELLIRAIVIRVANKMSHDCELALLLVNP